jgi:2-haloacid dehalogenase
MAQADIPPAAAADGIMPIAGLRALLFDTFGTVVDWRTSLIAAFRGFAADRGLDFDCTAFVDEWKTAYRPGMDAVRSGKAPWTTVEAIYRRALEEMLPRYGLERLTEDEKLRLLRTWHRLKPWPDAVTGLTRLKQRYIISPLSNGDVACLVGIARNAGLPWDLVLCAEVFRHYKPDPEVYLGAVELLDCRPEEVMLVAAHNYDLRAARAHGMLTAFVARPTEYGPGQTSDLAPEEDWDVVGRDFNELAANLGA